MWWPTHARVPLATQNVFLSSAPQARIGRSAASRAAACWPGRTRASAAGSPGGLRRSGDDAEHRVVGARLDRAVVDEEQVGDAGQPLAARPSSR